MLASNPSTGSVPNHPYQMNNTRVPDHFQLLKPEFEWQNALNGAITQDEYVDLVSGWGNKSAVSLAFSAAKLYINNQNPTHPGQQTLNILLGRTAKLIQMTREFSQIDPDGKWMELGRRVETAYHQFHNNLKDQGDCRDDLVRGHAVDNLVESLNTLANEHQTAAIKHPTHPSTQCSIFVDPDRGVKWPGEDGTTYSANIFGGFSSPSKIGSMKLWLKDTKR